MYRVQLIQPLLIFCKSLPATIQISSVLLDTLIQDIRLHPGPLSVLRPALPAST